MRELRKQRQKVEALLRGPVWKRSSLAYGGSKAKETMILESYDLDLHCYFAHDDTSAGTTLKEIYENVAKRPSGQVHGRTQAFRRLRLTSIEPLQRGTAFAY